jgi:hypothetical protein
MFFGENPRLCQNYSAHTPTPDGFYDLVEWVDKKSKTHDQTRCYGCGLYAVWVPKADGENDIEKVNRRVVELQAELDSLNLQLSKAHQAAEDFVRSLHSVKASAQKLRNWR